MNEQVLTITTSARSGSDESVHPSFSMFPTRTCRSTAFLAQPSETRASVPFFFISTGIISNPQQFCRVKAVRRPRIGAEGHESRAGEEEGTDRKSTRLNSSHQIISYAVFCLKKK